MRYDNLLLLQSAKILPGKALPGKAYLWHKIVI